MIHSNAPAPDAMGNIHKLLCVTRLVRLVDDSAAIDQRITMPHGMLTVTEGVYGTKMGNGKRQTGHKQGS